MEIPFGKDIPADFFWFNKPEHRFENNKLTIVTKEGSDYWQRTHYGFSRDDGHAMLSSVTGDFVLTARTSFEYKDKFDQCGLLVRIDALNWIKVSMEREDSVCTRLGSVVTNLGYSDWATSDIDGGINEMWYRISGKENDFILENSTDGEIWSQMRIAHLHSRQRPLNIGVYACSPKTGGFEAEFSELSIEKS